MIDPLVINPPPMPPKGIPATLVVNCRGNTYTLYVRSSLYGGKIDDNRVNFYLRGVDMVGCAERINTRSLWHGWFNCKWDKDLQVVAEACLEYFMAAQAPLWDADYNRIDFVTYPAGRTNYDKYIVEGLRDQRLADPAIQEREDRYYRELEH